MKKLILLSVLSVLGLTGCAKSEHGCRIDYIYINNCSSEVTAEFINPQGERVHLFTIPVNGQHTVTLYGYGGYPLPFADISWNFKDLTISNGEKTVTESYSGRLYNVDSYTFISKKKNHKIMQYVFTDDFFADGEPIN